MGFRPWYHWRLFSAVRGGYYKEMSHDYHLTNLKKAWRDGGVSGGAASAHVFRRAAAQMGKAAEVAVADNMSHGMRNLGAADGVYDDLIPNAPMMVALSGRPPGCLSPTTARLQVVVPDDLQRTAFSWLEGEEAAYAQRLVDDVRCYDRALLDFFYLLRVCRSIFFQTWAARLATTSVLPWAAILRHPLLNTDAFRAFQATMALSLSNAEAAVEAAVAQVLPQKATTVKVAVRAVAAASASGLLEAEERMDRRA